MAQSLVSVVIPTHDHGPTLRPSVTSALAQTHSELEVLIVGDGMPPEAVEVGRELEDAYENVRLFTFPKGERLGEAHRHEVLSLHVHGAFVFYLSDDDLWLPEHVEAMLACLEGAELAGATMATVRADGSLRVTPHALEVEAYRRLHLGAHNRVALSGIAHRADAYERGPGWTPAPPGVYTDHNFLRGMLGAEACRAVSSKEVTWLNFPSPDRREMSLAERVGELEGWWARVSNPEARREVDREIERAWRRAVYEFDELSIGLTEAYETHEAMLRELREALDSVQAEVAALRASAPVRAATAARRLAGRVRRGGA